MSRMSLALVVASGLALAASASLPATWASRLALVAAAVGLAAGAVVAWRSGVTLRRVLVVAVVLRAAMLAVPPGLSDDGWRYVFDGVVTAGGGNPYLHLPADEAVADAAAIMPVGWLNSASYFSVYPPLSQAMFAIGGVAARLTESPWVGLYAIKLLAASAELAALLLLARLVSPRALVLYAWNPLVVLEAVGQAHSEAFMLPLLVGTIAAMRAERPRLGGVLLAGAAMVKLYPALLLPLLWRRGGWRSVWPALTTMAVLALPFAHKDVPAYVASSLRLYASTFDFNAGPYYLVRGVLNALHDGPENVGRDLLAIALPILLLATTASVYLLDWRRRWPMDRSFAAVLGLVVVLSTTVHPWYLLGLLALPWTLSRPGWAWGWLGVASLATYVRYVPGGEGSVYLATVWVGWSGWALLLALGCVPWIVKRRARSKARRVLRALALHQSHGLQSVGLTQHKVLDLGCGEGHVGAALARRGASVTLCDVVDFRASDLPFVRYDGSRLPFGDDAFDVVVLYFVLHHSRDADATLGEALRVGRHVVVVESVYRSQLGLRVLTMLDVLANRLRGGRHMAEQEEHLHFRTADAWRRAAEARGAIVERSEEHGLPPHRQATLVLRRDARPLDCR